MKKCLFILLCATLLLNGCSSYTATGAYVGGEFGRVVGSAIGSISGGRHGYAMGTVIGTVGGIAAGAAVGAAVESAQNRNNAERMERQYPQRDDDRNSGYDNRQVASNDSYDDRITFDGDAPATGNPLDGVSSYSVSELSRKLPIEVRNAAVYDSNHDGVLTRGEQCTVVFEIMNNTPHAIFDVYPLVEDVTANKHVKISPNLRVESIAPFNGIRYTATIVADRKLKDGEIVVQVGVAQGDKVVKEQTQKIVVPTKKKM